MSYRTTVTAGETRTLSFSWVVGSVLNEGPSTVLVDGSPVMPGGVGVGVGYDARDVVVTTLDQPATIGVNTAGTML